MPTWVKFTRLTLYTFLIPKIFAASAIHYSLINTTRSSSALSVLLLLGAKGCDSSFPSVAMLIAAMPTPHTNSVFTEAALRFDRSIKSCQRPYVFSKQQLANMTSLRVETVISIGKNIEYKGLIKTTGGYTVCNLSNKTFTLLINSVFNEGTLLIY